MIKADFFSKRPPLTLFEEWQIKNGLNRFLRPKDVAIKERLDNLHYKNAKHILDFGCADGVWLERILRSTKSAGVGVDIAVDLIKVAIDRKDRRGVYYDSGKTWPVKDNSIDFCFSFDVFEHLRNRQAEIDKLSRSIKKGGKILIFTLNPNNKFTFDWLFESFGSDWLYKRADHLKSRFVSPQNLAMELEKNDFKDISFELYPGPLNLILDVFCYAYLKIIEKIFHNKSNWILDLNSRYIRFIYRLNLKFDKMVNAKGYSNGYFLWAEKK
ncbi:MAG TPA: class I SAM-dependent methyltransferase [Candidatus Saccharimonadales bacterium]|jgi:2-polyprenyl-3-methyl-5-hydroxy-6-metoxy-1,4-benzoquinol methylase|nr:class I SAM-dependent methyltransferase [Candidatus Saccharimonadales bacterium]